MILQTKKIERDISIVSRFSWHKGAGDFAEGYFRRTYFKGIGLRFRKIRKDRKGKKPDGYVLDQSKIKIALAEIKLIKFKKRSAGVQLIKTDSTISNALRGAKKQLKAIDDKYPKIIYLIRDESFFKPITVRQAIFGKWKTTTLGEIIVFNNHSGLDYKSREDNKLRDTVISAIICYIPVMKGYKLWIYRNQLAKPVPNVFLDKSHIEELWDYDGASLRRII